MIKTKEDLRFYIQEDAKRNGIISRKQYLKHLLFGAEQAFAFRYLKCMRNSEYYQNTNKTLLHTVLFYFYSIKKSMLGAKYHIQIPNNKTGYGLRIMHLSGGGGILLNVSKVGNYCGFNAGVLLGDNGEDKLPVLGNHVAFGPGSKAFGDVVIGDNVFVAPNSVVIKDVPSNVIVGGVPAKILKNKD